MTALLSLARKLRPEHWVIAGLAVVLLVQGVRLNMAEARGDRLYEQINAPITGYVARLTTCQNSLVVAEGAVERQNQAIDALERESADRLERAQQIAAEAEREAELVRARAQSFLDRPIEGETVCERVLDVDAAILAELEG